MACRWNTATTCFIQPVNTPSPPPCIYGLSVAAFTTTAEWRSWDRDHVASWCPKPKIFTLWLSVENFGNPCVAKSRTTFWGLLVERMHINLESFLEAFWVPRKALYQRSSQRNISQPQMPPTRSAFLTNSGITPNLWFDNEGHNTNLRSRTWSNRSERQDIEEKSFLTSRA